VFRSHLFSSDQTSFLSTKLHRSSKILRTRETDLHIDISQFQVRSSHIASSFSVPNNHSFRSQQQNHLLAQGQTQGSMLQHHTNKTINTDPFGNTCEADEVSPEVEAGVVAGLQCLQP
jgi:hypothetical protein